MSINFKPGTTPGETVEEGGITWEWDGQKWNRYSPETTSIEFVKVAGDTMTGSLNFEGEGPNGAGLYIDARNASNLTNRAGLEIRCSDGKPLAISNTGSYQATLDIYGYDPNSDDVRKRNLRIFANGKVETEGSVASEDFIKAKEFRSTKLTSGENSNLEIHRGFGADEERKMLIGSDSVNLDVNLKLVSSDANHRNIELQNGSQIHCGSGEIITMGGSGAFYRGNMTTVDHLINKGYVDGLTDQLHQDVISLDEEIESIAKSMEKGFWRYEEPSGGVTSAPLEGRFFLVKNFNSANGMVGSEFTQDYSEAEAVVLHNNEWNRDEANGSGGATHTWGDVEVDELIDLIDRPDPDFLFGKITFVDAGGIHADAVVIGFDKIEFDGSPTNHISGLHETLLKIFKEPTGGTASEFVKKTGDKMSGTLTMGDTLEMPDGTNTDSAPITFKAKNTSNTIRTNTLKVESTSNTLHASGPFSAGGSISTTGNIEYNGDIRIGLGSTGTNHYLGFGSNVNQNVMQWNQAQGIIGIRAANSWGSNGRFLAYSTSTGLEWKTALTSQTQADWNTTNTSSASYIRNKPTISSVSDTDFIKNGNTSAITITKTSNTYYITGG